MYVCVGGWGGGGVRGNGHVPGRTRVCLYVCVSPPLSLWVCTTLEGGHKVGDTSMPEADCGGLLKKSENVIENSLGGGRVVDM